MKRLVRIMLVVMCVCTFAACKKDDKTPEGITSGSLAATEATVKVTPFRIKCNGGYLMVGMKADDALALAGEARQYTEIASCAFEGLDKIYIYNGYEIYVNTVSGKEVVSRIVLTDDSALTKEGLYIGATLDSVLKAYGEKYTESNGIYKYYNGEYYLNVGIRDNKVISIETYMR